MEVDGVTAKKIRSPDCLEPHLIIDRSLLLTVPESSTQEPHGDRQLRESVALSIALNRKQGSLCCLAFYPSWPQNVLECGPRLGCLSNA